jgi:hypothetical protein
MFLAGAQPGRREWAVKPISRSQMEWRVGLDSGRSRGDFCRRANRPTEASKAAVCYVRNTSTPIKRRAGVRFLPLEAASCTASIRTGAARRGRIGPCSAGSGRFGWDAVVRPTEFVLALTAQSGASFSRIERFEGGLCDAGERSQKRATEARG